MVNCGLIKLLIVAKLWSEQHLGRENRSQDSLVCIGRDHPLPRLRCYRTLAGCCEVDIVDEYEKHLPINEETLGTRIDDRPVSDRDASMQDCESYADVKFAGDDRSEQDLVAAVVHDNAVDVPNAAISEKNDRLESMLSNDEPLRWYRVATGYLARKRINGTVINGKTAEDFQQDCVLKLWGLYLDQPRRFPKRYIERVCDTVLDQAFRRAKLWRHPNMSRASTIVTSFNAGDGLLSKNAESVENIGDPTDAIQKLDAKLTFEDVLSQLGPKTAQLLNVLVQCGGNRALTAKQMNDLNSVKKWDAHEVRKYEAAAKHAIAAAVKKGRIKPQDYVAWLILFWANTHSNSTHAASQSNGQLSRVGTESLRSLEVPKGRILNLNKFITDHPADAEVIVCQEIFGITPERRYAVHYTLVVRVTDLLSVRILQCLKPPLHQADCTWADMAWGLAKVYSPTSSGGAAGRESEDLGTSSIPFFMADHGPKWLEEGPQAPYRFEGPNEVNPEGHPRRSSPQHASASKVLPRRRTKPVTINRRTALKMLAAFAASQTLPNPGILKQDGKSSGICLFRSSQDKTPVEKAFGPDFRPGGSSRFQFTYRAMSSDQAPTVNGAILAWSLHLGKVSEDSLTSDLHPQLMDLIAPPILWLDRKSPRLGRR